jgi:hypothetical protein
MLLLGCAHASGDASPARGVVVSMTRLTVTPTPENNPATLWDRGRQDSRDDEGCGLLFALDFVAPGIGSAAAAVCSLSASGGGGGGQAKPEDPDLFVAFGLGSTIYTSPVIADHASHDLLYSLFIPRERLRDDDLHLSVYDHDGQGIREAELIAQHDIARGQLESKLELRGEAIGEVSLRFLNLEVSDPPPPQSATRSISASAGLVSVDELEIPAGMLIEIRASGRYTIGSWNDATLGPKGYPSNGPTEYNLPGSVFRKAKHGAAVALLQRDSAAQAVVVGECVRFVARSGGTLRVGVNDSDYQNNGGKLDFEIRVSTPDAETWSRSEPQSCSE